MKLYWRYKKEGKWTWAPAHVSAEIQAHLPGPVEEEE